MNAKGCPEYDHVFMVAVQRDMKLAEVKCLSSAWVLICQQLLAFWALSYAEINSWTVPTGTSGGRSVAICYGRLGAVYNSKPPDGARLRELQAETLPIYYTTWACGRVADTIREGLLTGSVTKDF